MMKIVMVIFVTCVNQVLSHHCGSMETCMKNVSSLETQASNFINNYLDKHDANLTRRHADIQAKFKEFNDQVDGGLNECKSFANSFHEKLSKSCGILELTNDTAVHDAKEYIDKQPIDFLYSSSFTDEDKKEMCPHLVKYYNFVCDRVVYDVETYLSCDINDKVNSVFEAPWKHCISTFKQ
ncbi:PREDICTED: uncharacterized protein LOC108566567 [Nicrophorus vespilloides]|uniref:Uncharacterized protein LOC108566567 n=1 Tax=Nicrophorus vespilloides TaxID=110193 RepID=A0ABM1N5C1_NICVS|nr:PREDICTED: uncharacterized protein LOC108566567 [Nicrophorus vespilloides]